MKKSESILLHRYRPRKFPEKITLSVVDSQRALALDLGLGPPIPVHQPYASENPSPVAAGPAHRSIQDSCRLRIGPRSIRVSDWRAGEPGSVAVPHGGAGRPFLRVAKLAILPKMNREWRMKALSAKDAKYNFGRMIDLARSEPVVIEKHGRPVVVVMAVEEYERLKSEDKPDRSGEQK